jgi:hypothetical protein
MAVGLYESGQNDPISEVYDLGPRRGATASLICASDVGDPTFPDDERICRRTRRVEGLDLPDENAVGVHAALLSTRCGAVAMDGVGEESFVAALTENVTRK